MGKPGNIALEDVVEEMERVIAGYVTKPILIGHSMGGLVGQVLMNKGRAAAGGSLVAPNAMWSFEWRFLRSTTPILNPLMGDEPQEMDERRFHHTFVNTILYLL